MEFKSYEDFRDFILDGVGSCPNEWRRGQAVFNLVDKYTSVARNVQFNDKVDCFYNDTEIDHFLECVWNRLNK